MFLRDLSALSKELNIKEPIEATKRTIGEKIVKSISKDELLVFAKKTN